MAQLHNKFTDTQVRELIEWYLAKKIGRKYVQEILGIKKTRFFALVQKMRIHPDKFSILYTRNTPTRKISKEVEGYIVKELEKEKELIENKDIPIKHYNYSYIKDILERDYGKKVSLPTIIDRAKRCNFYFPRPKIKAHEREIFTNYPGELIQHDSSHHQFSPYAPNWYLITSLDDFSCFILYAILIKKETS
jgi:hypothetical protein